MPISVTWDNEQHTVVRLDVTDRWTLDELDTAIQEVYLLIAMVDQPRIAVIMHFVGGTVNPPEGVLSHARQLIARNPDNIHLTVVVSKGGFARVMLDAIFKLNRMSSRTLQLTTAETLEEARAIAARKMIGQ
jgi:hypothetical protein